MGTLDTGLSAVPVPPASCALFGPARRLDEAEEDESDDE